MFSISRMDPDSGPEVSSSVRRYFLLLGVAGALAVGIFAAMLYGQAALPEDVSSAPLVSHFEPETAEAAAPIIIIVLAGIRVSVRVYRYAQLACIRWCVWINRGYSAYDAAQKARYIMCTVRRRPNCD